MFLFYIPIKPIQHLFVGLHMSTYKRIVFVFSDLKLDRKDKEEKSYNKRYDSIYTVQDPWVSTYSLYG